jgi:hypothetical protein
LKVAFDGPSLIETALLPLPQSQVACSAGASGEPTAFPYGNSRDILRTHHILRC